MKWLLSSFRQHASLLIMVAGAAGLFLATIILRHMLAPDVFGVFGLALTFVAFLASFGLLGSDQAVMRTARVTPEALYVVRSSARSMAWAALLAVPLMVLIGYWTAKRELPWLALSLLVVGCQVQLVLYNFLRLRSKFVSAQIVNNGWRLVFLAAVAALWIFDQRPAVGWMLALLLTSICLPLILVGILIRRWPVAFVDEAHPQYLWGFMIALGVAAILGALDRILVQRALGLVEFGDYFYAYTLIVSPFLVLAGYVGFREFVAMKQRFELPAFRWAVIRLGVTGVLLAAIWAAVLISLHEVISPGEASGLGNFATLPFLVFLAAVRLPQALLSAAVGARAGRDAIRRTNLVQIGSIIAVVLGVEFLGMGIHEILAAVCIVWVVRIGIYYQVARSLGEEPSCA